MNFPETQTYSSSTPGTSWLKKSRLLDRDYQSLSIFRIVLSLLLAYDFVTDKLRYHYEFYSDQGIVSRTTAIHLWGGPSNNFSLLYADNTIAWHALIYTVHALAILAFGFGYRTRTATVVLAVTWISFCMRDLALPTNADLAIRLFLVWSCFLPMNRYWSIDAALDPAPRNRPYPREPFWALKIQLAIIYFFACLWKLSGEDWINGSAVRNALIDNWVGATPYGLTVAFGASPQFMIFASFLVLAFQFSFSALIYCPIANTVTRGIALGGAFIMHGLFLAMLQIGWFPVVCWAYLLLLVPDDWWNAWFKKRRERLSKIKIFYDGSCPFCLKAALILREFCLPVTVPVSPADHDTAALRLLQQHYSWVLYTEHSKPLQKWEAVAYVLKKSPAFFWLGWLTGNRFAAPWMEKIYDFIGRNRAAIGTKTAPWLPIKENPPLGGVGRFVCSMMITLAVLHQIFTIHRPAIYGPKLDPWFSLIKIPEPSWVKNWAGYMEVYQGWDIFAPNPVHYYHKLQVTGLLKTGETIDIFDHLKHRPITMSKDGMQTTFAVRRWGWFFTVMESYDDDSLRKSYGRFLCREFNREKGPLNLRSVQIDYDSYDMSEAKELALPSGKPSQERKTLVSCD